MNRSCACRAGSLFVIRLESDLSELDPETERQIKKVSVQTGYPKDSLLFVLKGWSNFDVFSQTHIDADTLCWRLHDQAFRQYGSQARTQLKSWGIETTLDFGTIVFALAENGLVRISDQDNRDDFNNVFDFETEFSDFKYPQVTSSKQWKLSTLFVITALAAIAVSGASRNGLNGVYAAFFSSWFVFLGFCCLVLGITNRSRGWLFLVAFGIAFLAAGIFAFFTLSHW